MSNQGPLPMRPILILCLCNTGHFYAVCSLFSYAGIMCVDLGWAPDRNRAGFAAGFLQSANTLGRVLTASLWGFLAHRYGLKRCLNASMVFIGIGGILFGISTRPIAAILSRFIFMGVLNGWPTFAVPVSAEVAGNDRSAEVLNMIFASGLFVQLAGPALAGWSYGAAGRSYPQLAPSWIGAAICGLSSLTVARWLKLMDENSCLQAARAAETESAAAIAMRYPLCALIGLRALEGGIVFSFYEVVPLWAISSKDIGGLMLGEAEVARALMMSAVISVPLMLYGAPAFNRAVGLHASQTILLIFTGLLLTITPFSPGYVSLALLHALGNTAVNAAIVANCAMCNNITPDTMRSPVNGIAVTVESMFKGLAPASTGAAFAWTLQRWGRSGHSFVFLALAITCFLAALVSSCLPMPDTSGSRSSSTSGLANRFGCPELSKEVIGKDGGSVDDEAEYGSAPMALKARDQQATDGEQIYTAEENHSF